MKLSLSAFDYISKLVRQRTAIVLERDKAYLVETRLAALARREGFSCVETLVGSMRSAARNDLQDRVIEAIVTHETSFFRDGHPFEALRQTILPDLMRNRWAQRSLTIWSAACSSGQEPYSVAMLIREHFPALLGWELRILATDLSAEIIDRAGRGMFTALEVSRGLTPALRSRYFCQQPDGWALAAEVRRMVEFRQLNLALSWPALPTIDLVLLRNVLIYFDTSTKKTILGRVRQLLRPDGYLLLGSAETTLNLDDTFSVDYGERTSCYRPLRAS